MHLRFISIHSLVVTVVVNFPFLYIFYAKNYSTLLAGLYIIQLFLTHFCHNLTQRFLHFH